MYLDKVMTVSGSG